MSFTIQIGNKIITMPNNNESPGYGEGLVEFYKAVESALGSVQGPQDITQTTATLANNSSGNVNGFLFDTAEVKYIFAEFTITRTFSDATPTQSESGQMFGNYDGTDFVISVQTVEGSGGDPLVELDISNTGQVTYVSQDVTNTDTLQIFFKAKAIINE